MKVKLTGIRDLCYLVTLEAVPSLIAALVDELDEVLI